ncbi:MAG TPA: TetR/AcrR family transcriptional regulator [Acidobacteriaceae bacterium]|nr:TetR/AcrR family transcriptional regulator [Acidobacteriaceae bacterium]
MVSRRSPIKSRREESTEATRVAIIAAARKHFTRKGYSGAEIGRIAADARVTTGAIYHHFSGKRALFQAVAEQLEMDILQAAAVVEGANPWVRIQAGFEKLIDRCALPDVQRITFIEAPQVIGPDAWREIELRYAYGALRQALTALVAAKVVQPYPIELIARTLLALLHEASAEVARSPHDAAVRKQVSELVAGVFASLTR